jgi:hypothetical protein
MNPLPAGVLTRPPVHNTPPIGSGKGLEGGYRFSLPVHARPNWTGTHPAADRLWDLVVRRSGQVAGFLQPIQEVGVWI